MFALSFGNVCMCLLLQAACGKFIDLPYGYQEIEDSSTISQTSIEDVKNLELERITDEVIDEICKKFKVTIDLKEPESYANCLEQLNDKSKKVLLMKRNAEELEGSGDSNEQITTEIPEVTTKEDQIVGVTNKLENVSPINEDVPLEIELKVEAPIIASSENPVNPTEEPGSFQGGFDHILKNIPKKQNDSLENENSPEILKSSVNSDQINVKAESSLKDEEARTGESQEKPSSATPDNMILIVIGALGVIGALAFVYNFVKSRRESKEIDETIKLENEGKEMKEMKPLMKSPLAQNGAKSMEFIDADPQIHVSPDTRVEINHQES